MGRELIDASVRGGRPRPRRSPGSATATWARGRARRPPRPRGPALAVVRSSRTGGGIVERNVEMDDDRLGFIAADELNPQKARILLMLGLTRTRDPLRLQEMFYAY